MPNWKKLITSGSNAALNTLNVTTSVTASSALIADFTALILHENIASLEPMVLVTYHL